ncbi:MAG: ParB/RepB/Spo0J family partition protein [Erysipelotrichaceae bacterium]|nr:ParB/RepB/Spo0J family partition protein [Erysipelotrichaceae bacterium]MBR3694576.1 ParB/RepB/Spo0J family partition protein [Erysipelotrichales bacterium]
MASAKKNRALGKGLEAIFGNNVTDVIEQIQSGQTDVVPTEKVTIALSEIRPNPYQPRTVFDEEKLRELSESIKEHGVFTPVLVKKSIKGYDLIAGERRVRASKLAGLSEIPAIVVDFTDEEMMEIAMLENIQREDLSAIEEAIGYQNMITKLGYTQEALAKRVGKSREHIANMLRLLKLPSSVQKMVMDNELSMGHARALLPLDEKSILSVAKKAVQEGMSVRAVENLVKQLLNKDSVKPRKKEETDYSYPVKLMSDKLQTKVVIANKQISIRFEDDSDLNRILEILHMIEE